MASFPARWAKRLRALNGGGDEPDVTFDGYASASKTASGRAPIGSTVTVKVGSTTSGTAISNSSGIWTYVFGTAPAAGSVITATAPVVSKDFTIPSAVVKVTISGTPGAATVGTAYTFTPSTANGSGTKAFSLSGSLPAGLSFSSTTGSISGTPSAAGTASGIGITVTDASGSASLSGLSIVVSAAGATLLALSEPMAIGGNSYDAQSGNINTWLYALIESECRGLGGMGFLQARGGDRLTHLLDRIKPMKSQQSLRPFVMNIENDLADSTIADTTAGGDAIKARLDAVRAELVSVRSGARICAALNADTSGARSKPIAFARYKALVQADTNYDTVDESLVFQPYATSPVQSTDNPPVHPNTVISAMAVGKQRGQYLKSIYVSDPVMPANGAMPTNMMASAFNPATAWTATSTSPGLSVVQSSGFLRDIPTKAAHIFTVTGTATQDETLSTTAPDSQYRLTIPITATDAYAKVIASLMRAEIRSAAGGDPIGLATIQINNGFGQSFNKQHTASQGYAWDKAFSGLLPVLPATITGQTASVSFDLRFRGKLGVVADFEIRIADLNLPEMDTVALGAPAFTGYKFTTDATNRPILGVPPTTTPAAGSTIAVGGTIAVNVGGTIAGGNTKASARTWTVWRDGAQVGTMTPVRNGVAAVPYTAVSADSGKTLEVRQTVDNGIAPPDTFVIGTITVS